MSNVQEEVRARLLWIERDFPVGAAMVLGAAKPIVLSRLGVYNDAFWGSDIAFAGLSFDLWAFISIAIYQRPLVQNGDIPASNGERILVAFFTFFHIMVYIWMLAGPSIDTGIAKDYTDHIARQVFISGGLTFVLPALFVRRVFRNM